MTIGRRAPRTPEQLQQAWTKSIMEGTLNGKVVNAAPVALGSKLSAASRAASGGGAVPAAGGSTVQFAYDFVIVT